MFVTYDQAWVDQGSSWWAKANRAKEHIASLRQQVDEFRAYGPYSLTSEPTEVPCRLAYRLRFSKPVPVTISTTVGDALHNLRATLENLAFEVARRSMDENGCIFLTGIDMPSFRVETACTGRVSGSSGHLVRYIP